MKKPEILKDPLHGTSESEDFTVECTNRNGIPIIRSELKRVFERDEERYGL